MRKTIKAQFDSYLYQLDGNKIFLKLNKTM